MIGVVFIGIMFVVVPTGENLWVGENQSNLQVHLVYNLGASVRNSFYPPYSISSITCFLFLHIICLINYDVVVLVEMPSEDSEGEEDGTCTQCRGYILD